MLYKFDTHMNDDDFFEINKYVMLNSNDGKRNLRTIKIIFPLILLSIWTLLIIRGENPLFLVLTFIGFAIVTVIFLLTIKHTMVGNLKKRIKVMKKRGKLPYSSESVLEFYDDHFVETTTENHSEIKYTAIKSAVLNPDIAVYLFNNDITAYVIPIRYFGSTAALNEFLQFINSKTDISETVTK